MVSISLYYFNLLRLIIVILVIFIFNILYPEIIAAERAKQPFSFYKKYDITLSLSSGANFIVNASSFLEKYGELTGGNKNHFNVSPDFNGNINLRVSNIFRINVSCSHFSSSFEEYFHSELAPGFFSNVNEIMKINTWPLIASLEYLPTHGQFRTYTGIGGGIAYSKTVWQENILSEIPHDYRKGGLIFHEEGLIPVIKIHSGMELGFDREISGGLFCGILIDASYTHLFRYPEVFSRLREQLYNAPDYADDSIPLLTGYLSLHAGIYINFN